MNLAQVDFQQLRIRHILYKSKVRSVLYGGTFDEVFFSASGPLNQWFTSIGQQRYGREPDMRDLTVLHQELISIALQLFALYNSGKIDQAHDGMKQIDRKSEEFLDILTRLETKLSESKL